MEAAVFAESIPFNETRDYVKKVMSNATFYSALFTGKPQSLKERLAEPLGLTSGDYSRGLVTKHRQRIGGEAGRQDKGKPGSPGPRYPNSRVRQRIALSQGN